MSGLVAYSGSDTSDQESTSSEEKKRSPPSSPERGPLKKPRQHDAACGRIPLSIPQEVLSMFREEEEVPSEEGHGRMRSFPHVRGNWASYVFIPFLLTSEARIVLDRFATFLTKSFRDTEYVFYQNPVEDVHISLSRTVALQHHWIEPITSTLRDKFKEHRVFPLALSEVAFYCNEEKTRSFLGLKVDQGHSQLSALAQEVNVIFRRFRLEQFYEDPSFHASLFWCLGDILPLIDTQTTARLQEKWASILESCSLPQHRTGPFSSVITDIQFKCGNKLYHFDLDS